MMEDGRDTKTLKDNIKRELLKRTGIAKNESAMKDTIHKLTSRYSFLTREQQEVLADEVVSDILGLGPIEKLLKDASISEIMINGLGQVYVERNGMLETTDIIFESNDELMHIIEKILSPLSRHVTELEPFVDARLKDGSRVNVIIPPLSLIGPALTIRKFLHHILSIEDLIKLGVLTEEAKDFLKDYTSSRLNIVICGGPGSGKTTLLNILTSFIPANERIITIEDTVELCLPHKHKLSLQTKSSNVEGKGEITIRDLVKNALHMRPDRLIIGETRGEEALDMLQAMNIGQKGSMTTVHANSPLDALIRLETMSMMANANISIAAIRRQIISAIDVIIQVVRLPNGFRGIARISELKKADYAEYNVEDIFSFQKDAGRLVKL